MKITLSKMGSTDRGGDVTALNILLHDLEAYKVSQCPLDPRLKLILDLWIEYLDGIVNHLMAANMGKVRERPVFNLPFEEDFSERYPRVK